MKYELYIQTKTDESVKKNDSSAQPPLLLCLNASAKAPHLLGTCATFVGPAESQHNVRASVYVFSAYLGHAT